MAGTGTEGSQGVRAWLNRHPAATAGGVVALVALLVAFWVWPTGPKQRAYYSIDDGKSYFEASWKVPPYEQDGKEVVQAMVFSCNGGTPFVGYLLRYPPEAKAKIEAFLKDPKNKNSPLPGGGQIKRPGDKDWVAQFNPHSMAPITNAADVRKMLANRNRYGEVKDVKCPDGKGSAALLFP